MSVLLARLLVSVALTVSFHLVHACPAPDLLSMSPFVKKFVFREFQIRQPRGPPGTADSAPSPQGAPAPGPVFPDHNIDDVLPASTSFLSTSSFSSSSNGRTVTREKVGLVRTSASEEKQESQAEKAEVRYAWGVLHPHSLSIALCPAVSDSNRAASTQGEGRCDKNLRW